MPAEFTFSVDVDRSFVRIDMGGFFEAADISRFVDAQSEAYRQLRCGPNHHVTLVDMRGMQIQSQDSVTGFQRRLADPAVAARRIAFVVSRTLARLQIKRATANLPAALFTSEVEAMAWLLGEE